MNLQQAFSELEQFEVEVGRLYGWLAHTYAEDAEASIVFYRMHLEEKAHARLIRFQRRLVKQNPKIFREVEIDLKALREAHSRVTKILSGQRAPDLCSAVKVSFEIETSAAESHYQTAIRESYEGVVHLLDGLSSGDRQHAAALHEFGQKRGYIPSAAPSQIRVDASPPVEVRRIPKRRPSLVAKSLLEQSP